MLCVSEKITLSHAAHMANAPKFMVNRENAIRRLEIVRRAHGIGKGKFAASLGMYAPNYSRVLKCEFFLTSDQLYTVWRLYGADPAFIMEGQESGVQSGLLQKIRALDANA